MNDRDKNSAQAPLQVVDAEAAAWHDVADVVIVGYGGAGICAALEAAGAGATVIAIDRFAGGGATAMSGGIVYAGGGTSVQARAGITDSVDEMAKYLAMEVGDTVSTDTIRRYCEQSRDNIEWLILHGVPYQDSLYKDKIVYPPDGYSLYYSGNEKTAEYAQQAKPAARGHRPVGKGMTGNVMFAALKKSADAKGVKLLVHSPVTRLVIDATDRVIGVEINALPESAQAQHRKLYQRVNPVMPFNAATAARSANEAIRLEQTQGQRRLIRARRGVILSGGGFSHNPSMLREHAPFLERNVSALMRMSSLGCNGSGIQLGESVGGVARGMKSMYVGRTMSPPAAFLSGVLVNGKGERFVNEAAYNSIVGRAIAAQPDGTAWLIVTGSLLGNAVRELLFSGLSVFKFFGAPLMLNLICGGTKIATSLEALARKCGIDPATLTQTIRRYNEAEDFGKPAELRERIEGKRYVAVNFSVPNKFAFTQLFTLGGLNVDEASGLVLRADGSAVPGLYAAGRTAFGLCSHNYISGLSIGDCIFTGRRAARHCTRND